MRRKKSKKRGPVTAKKITYDGINFASGLERYTYIALKKEKLFEYYEGEVFSLSKVLILQMNLTKNKQTGKVITLTEGARKYWALNIRLTLLEKTTS